MLNRQSRLTVLLVDDSPERTAILRAALENARYDVAEVLESTFALLRAVEGHQPDVIIIDTEDSLLVCSRERTQDVKRIVEKLQQQQEFRYL